MKRNNFLKQVLLVIVISIEFLLVHNQAFSLDCTKASTVVEKAICRDADLKKADEQLSRSYFANLKNARISGFLIEERPIHDLLQENQKEWLSIREKKCQMISAEVLKSCILEKTKKQFGEINKLTIANEENISPLEGLNIGGIQLTIEPVDFGNLALKYNGKVIIEANSAIMPSFVVLQHWKSKATSAVLIQAASGGTLQCSQIHVLETRDGKIIKNHELGDLCGAASNVAQLVRTKNGFALVNPPMPSSDGTITEWNGVSGMVTDRKRSH